MENNFELEKYIEDFSTPEDPTLYELNRETNISILRPRMLSGHIQGLLLEMLSTMIRPKRILEIGTFTGYSALCLAKGLEEDGLLHTIEVNDELEWIATKYFEKADIQTQIKQHIGDSYNFV